MNTITLVRLNALAQLDKYEMYEQLEAIIDLLGQATPKEINEFDKLLNKYSGLQKQGLKNCIDVCRRYFSRYGYKKPKREKPLKTIQKSFPKKQNKKATRNIFSFLGCFRFWGSQQHEQQKPETQDNQPQLLKKTQPTKSNSEVKVQQRENQNQPTTNIHKSTEQNKEASLDLLQQEQQQLFLSGQMGSADQKAKQKSIEKDKRTFGGKLKKS